MDDSTDFSDFVNHYTNKFNHLYYSTVEKFLTSLGATIENIKEWQLVTTSPSWILENWVSVRRNGVELGKIRVSNEMDSTGYRIVLECVDLRSH